MAALLYLADARNRDKPDPAVSAILLEDNAAYWYLYRYFEGANLDRRTELIDLYGGTVVEGYQLHRLQTELELALDDTERKPSSFDVLVGWSNEKPSVETERWQRVEKVEVLALIAS